MSKDRVDKVTADLLSRRSLLSSRTAYLLSLIAIPQLLYACGSSQSDASPPPSSGSETKQPVAKKSPAKNRRKRQSADAEANESTQDAISEVEDKANAQVNDDDVRHETDDEILAADHSATGDSDSSDSATATNTRDQAAGQPQSMVRGATPDSGFFSASAPQLTREQILAGQQIRGRCEGGLHELIIEPEHLQALARGEAVTIRSSTHTHIGNPTVHNHSIRYTPQFG